MTYNDMFLIHLKLKSSTYLLLCIYIFKIETEWVTSLIYNVLNVTIGLSNDSSECCMY